MDFQSKEYSVLGDGGYDLGARAGQIRDDLKARDHFAPDDMLATQLDDRAVFLTHWHDVLLDVFKRAGDAPNLAEMNKYTVAWGGRADPASVSYRLTRNFRTEVIDTILDGFAGAVRAKFRTLPRRAWRRRKSSSTRSWRSGRRICYRRATRTGTICCVSAPSVLPSV